MTVAVFRMSESGYNATVVLTFFGVLLTMKKLLTPILETLLLGGLVWMPVHLSAAEDAGNRACNLQGREIALRVTEEVSPDTSASERNRIAAIAEQVCLDFAVTTAGPAPANMPVISRPAAAQQPAQAVAAPVAGTPETAGPATAAEEAAEEDSGLLGDIRIIDPEDRVRRPGLKRR
jgi:hypothetical protein